MYGMGFNQYTVNGQAVLNAVENYFGSADPFYLSFSEYGLDAPGALRALEQVPNVRVIRSITGEPLNIEYFADEMVASSAERAALATAGALNSNAASAAAQTTGVSVATHVVTDTTTGAATAISAGAVGAGGSVVSAICTKVLPALWAVGTGWSIGCAIDEALYETGNDIWNIGSMRAYNPAYWDNILFDRDVLGNDEPTITGLLDANGTMYTDERMLAYLVGYLNSIGAFSSGNVTEVTDTSSLADPNVPQPIKCVKIPANTHVIYHDRSDSKYIDVYFNKEVYAVSLYNPDSSTSYYIYFMSKEANTVATYHTVGSTFVLTVTLSRQQISGVTDSMYAWGRANTDADWLPVNQTTGSYSAAKVTHSVLYGTQNTPSAVEGINKRTGYDYPQISSGDTIEQILNKLKQQYPDLWQNKLTTSMPNDQGNIQERNYVPVGIPDGGTSKQPTISDNASPQYDPSSQPQSDTIVRSTTPTGNPTDNDNNPDNGNDTGSGDSPVVIPPVGSASSLYTVYNPTESEIQSFGAWLWSANFVDQLLKMFQDPMQAIIGLHKVFVTPQISGRQNITVGYLDSGVPANKVSHQYTTDDLGSVDLKESFGNVFDYSPYTKISLYLPFVGFVDLDPADVMRSKINVVYHTDVLTGAMLVEVKVKRDTHLSTLYTFNCDGAVHYPLSSMSYMGIVANTVGVIAGGIAAAAIPGAGAVAAGVMATGNAAKGLLSGGGGINIQRSGGLSGNAGAMGCKKPYLVITRPQTRVARTAPHHQGYPSNFSTVLGNCYGYTRVKTALLSSIDNATEKEKKLLEDSLKRGVLI